MNRVDQAAASGMQTIRNLGSQTTMESIKNNVEQARNTLQSQKIQNSIQNFSKSASIAANVSRALHDIAMKFVNNIRA